MQIVKQIGVGAVIGGGARDDDVIRAGFGMLRKHGAGRGAKPPPDAIAPHRLAELAGDREADPNSGIAVRAPALNQEK